MIELAPSQWRTVEHVIDDSIPLVSVTMRFQRRGPGWIWVDRVDGPGTVVAVMAPDALVWGDLSPPWVVDCLAKATGMIADTPGLRPLLDRAWGRAEPVPSVLFESGQRIADLSVPRGYTVMAVDADSLPLLREFWKDEYPGVIGDFDDDSDFLTSGFGFMAIHDATGRCVSASAAISVSRGRYDHGVDTHTAHRRRGLASACVARTVDEGLRRGLKPVYVADGDNAATQGVARRAGLVKTGDVLFYRRPSGEDEE